SRGGRTRRCTRWWSSTRALRYVAPGRDRARQRQSLAVQGAVGPRPYRRWLLLGEMEVLVFEQVAETVLRTPAIGVMVFLLGRALDDQPKDTCEFVQVR